MGKGVGDLNSVRYEATCQGSCKSVISLSRSQVATGRNPLCEHCGGAMTVASLFGARQPSGHVVDPRAAK